MAQQAISARRCSHSAPKAWVVVSVLPQTADECATLPSCERALFEDASKKHCWHAQMLLSAEPPFAWVDYGEPILILRTALLVETGVQHLRRPSPTTRRSKCYRAAATAAPAAAARTTERC